MKILWICQFSNSQVRNKLQLSISSIEKLIRKITGVPPKSFSDIAVWLTNGIKELEKFKDIELHIISPHIGLEKRTEYFTINGIHYHFFKSDTDYLFQKLKRYGLNQIKSDYKGNRKIVQKLINQIKPDIIHYYGAENPQYSITALDIDIKKYPLLITLQTLMNDKDFKANYPISNKSYFFRSKIENAILQKTTYISSEINKYRRIVWQNINKDAIFMNSFLALEQKVKKYNIEKKFDFVYFAASVSKAADVAIEAFALVYKEYPNATINIIGATPEPFTEKLKSRIKELYIEKNVIFSGQLPTHDDVIRQIQFSKFALLPLKIDIISGTIREAMFSGLPVVTTITPGTPSLNEVRESVLLSEQGDFQAIANNMIKLIESLDLAKKLAENALITVNERWNNYKSMSQLVDAYKAIINHHHNGTPIPSAIGTKNPNVNHAE